LPAQPDAGPIRRNRGRFRCCVLHLLRGTINQRLAGIDQHPPGIGEQASVLGTTAIESAGLRSWTSPESCNAEEPAPCITSPASTIILPISR
jgi:hypothetical protein